MAEAALTRAQDFHVSHADFRFERVRYQDIRVRDGRLQGASDTEDVGFAVRVILNGAWGFASGRGAHPRLGRAGRRDRHPDRAGRGRDDHPPGRPRPRADVRRRHLGQRLRRRPARRAARGEGGAAHRLVRSGSSTPPAWPTPARLLKQVVENKFYADLAGTTTTQQRVRLLPELEAFGTDEDTGTFDSMRTIAPPVGRGWEYLTDGGYDWDSRARPTARAARREAQGARRWRPGATTSSSTRRTCG